MSCSACNEEIPVWEKFCPECGGNQVALVTTRQPEFSELLATIKVKVKDRGLDGLVDRAVVLRGDRNDLQKLQTQLRER